MFNEIKRFCLGMYVCFHNTINHIRWQLVCDDLNCGRKRILRGGVWVDKDNNIYNVRGDCVGKVEFNEGFGRGR